MRPEETGFGYIVIDGVRYDHDVVLFDNIERRRKELSMDLKRRYGHTPLIGREIKEYFGERKPEVLVIGTGQYGALPTVEVEEVASELSISVIKARTPEAIGIYNRLKDEGKKVVAIFHVTC